MKGKRNTIESKPHQLASPGCRGWRDSHILLQFKQKKFAFENSIEERVVPFREHES